MNNTNRLPSKTNTSKVEFAYQKPVTSSDLNEIQTNEMYHSMLSNNLSRSPMELRWTKVNNSTIRINEAYFNYILNPSAIVENEVRSVRGHLLSSNLTVSASQPASNNKYRLNVFYRTREVNSLSTIYRDGLLSNNISTMTGVDHIIPNTIYDTILDEEVSTRVITEFTFTLTPWSTYPIVTPTPHNTPDEVAINWNRLQDSQVSMLIEMNRDSGIIGVRYNGPRIFDYCIVNNEDLLPKGLMNYELSAFKLSTKQILYKGIQSDTWIPSSVINTKFIQNGSFVKINKFLEGSDLDGNDCTGKSGYILWDTQSTDSPSIPIDKIILDPTGIEKIENAFTIGDKTVVGGVFLHRDENDNYVYSSDKPGDYYMYTNGDSVYIKMPSSTVRDETTSKIENVITIEDKTIVGGVFLHRDESGSYVYSSDKPGDYYMYSNGDAIYIKMPSSMIRDKITGKIYILAVQDGNVLLKEMN